MSETPIAPAQFRPRLNHVAFTMDRSSLDDAGRAEILDFYGEVFGWTEGDNSMEEGDPLILYTGEFAQFVYLLPGDDPLVCPRLDHFGFQVATRAELEDIVGRAKTRQATDERISIIDVKSRLTHGEASEYELTSAYVGFLLPFMVELQHIGRRG
ncbi:MAG: hypothetical protein ACKOA9_11760 [Actinomycetota bacterium]